MTSTALQQFLASLDREGGRQETYDVAQLGALAPADRTAAEDTLLARAQAGDARAALTLGEADCRRALPALEQLAAGASDVAPFARRAVLRLRRDEQAAADVAGDATRGGMYQRFAATVELGRHGGAAARQGLERALDDEDALVRMQAAEGLVEQLGLTKLTRNAADDDVEPRSPLRRIYALLSSDLPSLSRPAADELRRIAHALDAGKTPAELDLVYHASADPDFRDKLSDALMDDAAAIPLDLGRRASPHDRAFAEALLAIRLQPSLRDVRAPTALADLGARWARPALEESRHGVPASDPFAVAVAAALARLAQP